MSKNNAPRYRQFKNIGRGTEDGRRERAGASLELRKIKEKDQLMKRRNMADVDIDEPVSSLQEQSTNKMASPSKPLPMAEIVSAMASKDKGRIFWAVQSSRKVLSTERNPPINEFIDAGVIPYLITYLECADNSNLQFEAAWALSNIASGTSEQTYAVTKAGAIPKFVALLKCEVEHVCEQAVWALGNIAGDGPDLRDQVIDAGAVSSLISLVGGKVSFLRNVAWTLSNLCRNKNPPPSFETWSRCLPVFGRLLTHYDSEVLSDTCWGISYITDGTDEKIQAVLDLGVLTRLVELLYHKESVVTTPALKAIGNIATGTEEQTQSVVNEPNALQAFSFLLTHHENNIREAAAWAISNITAGNQSQIQAVINANIIPGVVELLKKGDFKTQKECVYVITNLTSGGTWEQTSYVVEQGVLLPLVDLMVVEEPKTVLVVLDAINNILVEATKHSPEAKAKICLLIEEVGILDKLESLQEHDNTEIYKYCLALVENYFCLDPTE